MLHRCVAHSEKHTWEEETERGRECGGKIKNAGERLESREAKCHAEGKILYTKYEIWHLLQVKENVVRRRVVRDKDEYENMEKLMDEEVPMWLTEPLSPNLIYPPCT